MSNEMMMLLIAAGLTKQQATSVTAETTVRTLMQEDGKALIKEAKAQVDEMKTIVLQLRDEYYNLMKKMNEASETLFVF